MMSRLVPKLRFEEFLGEWEEKILIDICEKISQGGTPDTSKKEYWNGNIEWLTPAEMGGLNTKYIKSTNRKITKKGLQKCSSDLLPINSVILSTRAPIGHILINKKEMAINQGCKALIVKINISHDYLYYYLLKNKKELNDLGAGNTFKELSAQALKKFHVSISKDKEEQQKIANTLSSLDNLIEAQNKKVEALKKHKKGLMQRLFPKDGEKVPKLRFEEFFGEWEEKILGEQCFTISSGKTKALKDGNFNVYGSTGIIGKTESFTHNGTYILVARVGANAGLINYVTGKFSVTDNTLIIDLKKDKIIPKFLMPLLYKSNLNRLVFGSGQPLITGKQLKELRLFLPKPPEQQKIANCLSSLDNLIESQNKKVEALKKHKKALMQGMFVSGEVGV